jgi:transcriptional regulator with XRE-family HTH domain
MNIAARNSDEIGKLIKYFRTKKGYTQAEFAKLTGLTQATVSNIERGIGGTLKALTQIMNVLEVEIHMSPIKKVNAKDILQYLG